MSRVTLHVQVSEETKKTLEKILVEVKKRYPLKATVSDLVRWAIEDFICQKDQESSDE